MVMAFAFERHCIVRGSMATGGEYGVRIYLCRTCGHQETLELCMDSLSFCGGPASSPPQALTCVRVPFTIWRLQVADAAVAGAFVLGDVLLFARWDSLWRSF